VLDAAIQDAVKGDERGARGRFGGGRRGRRGAGGSGLLRVAFRQQGLQHGPLLGELALERLDFRFRNRRMRAPQPERHRDGEAHGPLSSGKHFPSHYYLLLCPGRVPDSMPRRGCCEPEKPLKWAVPAFVRCARSPRRQKAGDAARKGVLRWGNRARGRYRNFGSVTGAPVDQADMAVSSRECGGGGLRNRRSCVGAPPQPVN